MLNTNQPTLETLAKQPKKMLLILEVIPNAYSLQKVTNNSMHWSEKSQ